ncbi:uncharacterized protein ACNLHF_000178 [Anomaloglossus baeobatrachus]
MRVVPALLLFWGWLPSSGASCTTAYGDKIRYCKTFQTDYIEGIEILIFEERDVGRINSTVFSSPNLKSVLSLTLKGSNILTIESGAFQQFKGLGNIELQDNGLTTLSPSWFHDPGTLKNLTVANNSIRQLRPEMLDGFTNLERLNLSRNQITSIHSGSFSGLSKMASLDLSYNKISSLRWQTLTPLNGTLRLGGNPWNCSCAHKDFILFLKELVNASRLADATSVTCRYPPDLSGSLVWNLSEINCSLPASPPLPEAVFHKVVLPVLFVVLGGLFFSASVWLIVCILTSRCKNKVTNVADPERPLRTSSEDQDDPNSHCKGSVGSHIRQSRLIGSSHPCHETTDGSEIRSTVQTGDPGTDWGRFLHSEMRTSKSEPLVVSLGVTAPVLDTVLGSSQTSMYRQDPNVTSQSSTYRQDPNISQKSTYTQDQNVTSQKSMYMQDPNLTSQNSTYTQDPNVTSQKSTYRQDPNITSQKSTYTQDPNIRSQKSTYRQDPNLTSQSSTYTQDPNVTSQSSTYRQDPNITSQKSTYTQDPNIRSQKSTYRQDPNLTSQSSTYTQDPNVTSQSSTYRQDPNITSQKSTYRQDPNLTSQNSTYTQDPNVTSQSSTYRQDPNVTSQKSTYRQDPNITSQNSMYRQDPSITSQKSTYRQDPNFTSQNSTYRQDPNIISQSSTYRQDPNISQNSTYRQDPNIMSQSSTYTQDPNITSQSSTYRQDPNITSQNSTYRQDPNITSQNSTYRQDPNITSQNSTYRQDPNITSQKSTYTQDPNVTSQNSTYRQDPNVTSQNSTYRQDPNVTSQNSTYTQDPNVTSQNSTYRQDPNITSQKSTYTQDPNVTSQSSTYRQDPNIISQKSTYRQDPKSMENQVKQNVEASRKSPENESGVYGDPEDNLTGETGLVTYFDTHIDSMNNATETRKGKTEGDDPSPEHLVSSSNGSPSRFGKKCKTWSTFCGHDALILNPAERSDVPTAEIGKGQDDGKLCQREETTETSGSNQEEEGISEPIGDYDIGNEGHQHKDVPTLQILQESRIEEGPCRRHHQGSSKKTNARATQQRSSSAREKFWRCHQNCCDEFNPCPTASKVLKRSEKRSQKSEEVKQEPPSDDELLEERPSLPLLLSKPLEGSLPTNQELSSKKTCVSLPNLGIYDGYNPSVISVRFPEPVITQDETANDVLERSRELPVIDLSAEDHISHERLVEGSWSKTKFPFVSALTEGLIKAEDGLYDASRNFGLIGGNDANGLDQDVSPCKPDVQVLNGQIEDLVSYGRNCQAQDVLPCKPDLQVLNGQAEDLVSYGRNCQALPDINTPSGAMLGEDEISQVVVPVSNLDVPSLNLQTESPLRYEIRYNMSSNSLHLPIIDVLCVGNTVERLSIQEDLLANVDVPIVEDKMVTRDKKFDHVSPDVQLPKIDGLPTTEVQSQVLVINESNPSDILQCPLNLLAISEPPKDKILKDCKSVKAGKQKGKQYVKAKSCPVFSDVLDAENPHRNLSGLRLKSKLGSKTIDPKINMMASSDARIIKSSKESPSKVVETMNQESPRKEQELIPGLNLNSETQLTPSCSYSLSIQDEISEWPKITDLLKRSSTISLSSKYDILESCPVPSCKDDHDKSTVRNDGHSDVNSDSRSYGMDNSRRTSVFHDHKADEENSKTVSSPEECSGDKYKSENTLHTRNTSEKMADRNSTLALEKEMTNSERPPQRSNQDTEVMNDQTMDDAILMRELTHNNSKGSSNTSSVQDVCHESSLVSNGESDLDEHEDASDDRTSSLASQDQTTEREVSRNNHKETENPENVDETGRDQVIQDVRLEYALMEPYTDNLDTSPFINEDIGSVDVDQTDALSESGCKSADTLKGKNCQEDGFDRIEEIRISDLENQSSLQSRRKDVTSKIRRNIGGQNRATNKTPKTENTITPCIREDYLSTRLSRRIFQTVFPISLKTPSAEDGNKLGALTLEEQSFENGSEILNPQHGLPNTLSQNITFSNTKMMDAIEYLTSLYARTPAVKKSQDSQGVLGEDDKTIDDIRVLANLHFCKVSGPFIADAQKSEIPEIIDESTEDPKLSTSILDNPYIPPSKEELKADEELAVLNIMYTIKKSLELSAAYDTDNGTDI